LIDKLLKNIVDNPDEDKFRSVKVDNKRLNSVVTRHKAGVALMKLVGFAEVSKEGGAVWSNQGSVSYLKGCRLDLAAGLSVN